MVPSTKSYKVIHGPKPDQLLLDYTFPLVPHSFSTVLDSF